MNQSDLLLRLSENKQRIFDLAIAHKAFEIKVFGSVARGDNNQNSDVDFLVSFNDKANLFDLIALKQDLENLLECPVDIATPSSLKQSIRTRVLSEAKDL
jgi:predicted nucleotidyltransferase